MASSSIRRTSVWALYSIALWLAILLFDVVPAFGQDDLDPISVPEPSTKQADLTLDELRQGVRTTREKLWALEVTYSQTTRNILSKDAIIGNVKYHFAYKLEKRFRSQTIPSGTSTKGAGNQDLRLAFDGNCEQSESPALKTATITPRKEPFIDIDAFTQAVGIALTDNERATIANSDFFLPTSLENAAFDWSVEPNLGIVDGAECHVLVSKDKHRLWIDPNAGFAVRFREQHQFVRETPKDKWPLRVRYAFKNPQLVADGIWLPRRVEVVAYVSARQPENMWNRPDYVTTHEVNSLSVNDGVSDTLFTLSYPLGTVVRDMVRNRFYRIGNANEELDIVVEEGQRELTRAPSRTWLIAINFIVIFVLAVLIATRIVRKKVRGRLG